MQLIKPAYYIRIKPAYYKLDYLYVFLVSMVARSPYIKWQCVSCKQSSVIYSRWLTTISNTEVELAYTPCTDDLLPNNESYIVYQCVPDSEHAAVDRKG